jgi:hypothetical protein
MKYPAAAAILGLLLVHCSDGGKREASALTEAVDRFRRADSDAARAAQAQTVSTVACTAQRVCDAKNTCMLAIDPTVKAFALKGEVSSQIAEIEGGRLAADSAEARALPAKLGEATRLLQEGHRSMDKCDSMLTDLRVTYGF